MATLIDLVDSVCNGTLSGEKACFTQRDSQNGLADLKHHVMVDLWSNHLPEELCAMLRREIGKIKAKFVKREQRHNARYNELPVTDLPTDSNGASECNVDDLTSLAHDDFECETLLAVMGLHPHCENFAELAATGTFGGVPAAYKRRAQFLERLRIELDVTHQCKGN